MLIKKFNSQIDIWNDTLKYRKEMMRMDQIYKAQESFLNVKAYS